MSREIKFRLWDKIDKKIVDIKDTDSLYIKNNKVFNIYEYEEFGVTRIRNVDVSCRYEILLYTGLNDMNGKEIYEGDMVSLFHNTQISEVRYNRKYGCWEINVALSIHSTGWDLLGNHIEQCEVIGNIYENPELLEGDK